MPHQRICFTGLSSLFLTTVFLTSTTLASTLPPPLPISSTNDPRTGQPYVSPCDLGGVDLEADGFVNACSDTDNAFIYCRGKLLEAVNYHQLLVGRDSKDFVDRPMLRNASDVSRLFLEQFGRNNTVRVRDINVKDINPGELMKFLEENFDKAGGELQRCDPKDWTASPPELERIRDDTLRGWAMELNHRWKELCRTIPDEIKHTTNQHSLIYVPNPFIVPGGRFREFYYWDAYWIMKGLIASGMMESVRSMIDNFLVMVERFGFVPNGGRIYYCKRTQPPFLTMMVYEYFEATHDYDFLKRAVPLIEKELDFWAKERAVDVAISGQVYKMFQYRTETNVPRPESFCVDVQTAKQKTKLEDKRQLWHNIASAAESGWDFSSRWMRNPEKPNLLEIETTNIVPVDLNAYLCGNYEILSHLYLQLGNDTKALEYHNKHYVFREAFQRVFFRNNDLETAGWYDYNLRTKAHNTNFYATIAIPLFTRCYHSIDLQQSERIFRTMERAGVFKEPGGVPTSMILSNEQWDYPNGWAPLNHMIIEGLRRSDNKLMQKKAFWLATKWVLSNYRVYRMEGTRGKMWEKYEVNRFKPNKGAGGEYEVQDGFGWTNGVILDLLTTFGDRIEFKNDLEGNPSAVANEVIKDEPPSLPEPKPNPNGIGPTDLNGLATIPQNSALRRPNSTIISLLAICTTFLTVPFLISSTLLNRIH